MKAPAFLLYVGDFLSSPDVQMMDTREIGAYCLLLFNAWQGDLHGHLPNNEDKMRRLTKLTPEQWEVSREMLLGKFLVADGGHTRYNPRMVAEAKKQENYRLRQAENGKRGGRPKKPNESQINPPLSVEKPTLSKSKPTANPNESFSISISTTTDVVEKAAAPEALKAKSKAEIVSAQVAADGGATYTADTFTALNDATTFANLMTYLGHVGIDTERYRLDIRGKVKAAALDVPAASMGKYIVSYLTRELAAGPLTPAPVAARAASVMPNDPCSLWGVPNPDYDHRTFNQTAGQYTGNVQ